MFGPRTSIYSLGTIINGISKTLNVVNQAIPLYNQINPMIKNARNALGIVKEFNKSTILRANNNINNIKKNIIPNNNRPTFFQ